ncbi:glycerol-3-phosphate 1-O-acyltransferase PlsY [Acidocella facilis]|uniref:glycerol-3-phosphate 1-O-acyltransferase PlsY n=1 Tax=Acidocella facilis TaxID=525 RepID=UPI00047DECF4|nr:glycerol-3-phosphate 1-O-acyltransferase PlsY [Acidocella facilis]
MILSYLGVAIFGYLMGSVPYGLLLTRLAGLGDIRSIGSGNIGATNVLRTGNKKLAAATLLLDALKGFVAVMVVKLAWHHGVLVTGIAAVLGHLFPVWLRFKGGKGVATGLGAFYGMIWPLGVICCAIWLLVAFTLRYSSLSALIAYAVAPVAALLLDGPLAAEAVLIISALVFWKHKPNIQRLLRGEEPRIGGKAAA